MEYTPDTWLLVKITDSSSNSKYKILAGFLSRFVSGESFRVSSPIKSVKPLTDIGYLFTSQSGSQYYCYKGTLGLNNISKQVLARGKQNVEYSVEVVDIASTELSMFK